MWMYWNCVDGGCDVCSRTRWQDWRVCACGGANFNIPVFWYFRIVIILLSRWVSALWPLHQVKPDANLWTDHSDFRMQRQQLNNNRNSNINNCASWISAHRATPSRDDSFLSRNELKQNKHWKKTRFPKTVWLKSNTQSSRIWQRPPTLQWNASSFTVLLLPQVVSYDSPLCAV